MKNLIRMSGKTLLIVFAFVLIITKGNGQKYFSKNAMIRFHSDSPMEKIEGVNSTSTTVIDAATGKLEFAALNNAFVFEKALMQEHFNENYMESSKFPKTVFKGVINDVSNVKFAVPGTYKVTVTGDMIMHGVTKSITIPAELVVDAKGLHANAKFIVKCSDYKIEIPAVVKDNISNDVEITVKVDYNVLSQ
jgi:polyisoprenoid-binding protein YceI